MIRRQKSMRFLGGFYAFPGGKVEATHASEEALRCCRGISTAEALRSFPASDGLPPLAFWVTAARELVEETGLLVGCDEGGRPVDTSDPVVRKRVESLRHALVAEDAPFHVLLAREGWRLDLAPFRYLSHFITPPSSPIRFTARFFLCRAPVDQPPALFTEETSEAFWIHPGEGYRRFIAGDMKMAEPAEYGLGYLAQFRSVDELWQAHTDGREKFCGVGHGMNALWKEFDWKQNRFPGKTS